MSINHLYTTFLFLTLSSISYLFADTNPLILPQDQTHIADKIESAQHAELSPAFHSFQKQLLQNFEELESILGMIFTLNTHKIDQLAPLIMPVFEIMASYKAITEKTPSDKELYYSYQITTKIGEYLLQVLNQDLDTIQEFAPLISDQREHISTQNLSEVADKLHQHINLLSEKINESLHDFVANLFKEVRDQLVKFDKILQTINTNVSNNTTVLNKAEIKQNIMNLRNSLHQLQREITSAGANNLQIIMNVFQFNKAILTYLQDLQKNKFTKWVPFDPIEYCMRAPLSNEDDGLVGILGDILTTSHEITILEKNAEKIDLTFTNKAARLVGDYIVDPFLKYNLGKYITTTIASAAGAGYLAYYFDNYCFTKPTSWFRNFFGYRPLDLGMRMVTNPDYTQTKLENFLLKQELSRIHQASPEPQIVEVPQEESPVIRSNPQELPVAPLQMNEPRPIKWLGKTEEFIYDYTHNVNPIGVAIIGYVLYRYINDFTELKPTLVKKMTIWFNRLKGGSYRKVAEKYDEFLPSTNFDDIIGLEYAKSLVYPHLKYIKDSERWDADQLTPPTGILLTGPTRSGKTFFAKAICGELHKQNPDKNIRFLTIDGHDIQEKGIAMWLGLAKMFAPCVLFIDEIDLLGLQRTENKALLSDFLQALSGISDKDPKKQVIVIATTNKPENIDKALVQGGRLALEIRFEYPTLAERKAYILKRLDQFAIDPQAFEIDLEKLGRETSGYTFEDIKSMLDAAFISIGIKGESISQQQLESALDSQIRKIITIDTKEISAEEKRAFSAHHAGHVLMHMLLDPLDKIAKATIRQVVVKVKEEAVSDQYFQPKKQTGLEQGGVFTYLEHDTFNLQTNEQLTKKAKTFVAGRIAEKIINGTTSTFYGWKKNSAFTMLRNIVADGLEFESLSKTGQDRITDDAQALLKMYEQEVAETLQKYEKTLRALTDALQEKQTLTRSEILTIIADAGEITLS